MIRPIVMRVIDESNHLLFLINGIHQDIMANVKATVALQLVPERFAYLRIHGKLF
jgi:hypothetical protein